MRSRPSSLRLLRFPALAAVALVVTIGFGGARHLRGQQRRFREQAEAQLSAVADLKVSQIVAWRRERIADASDLTENRLVARELKSVLTGSRTRSIDDDCRAWLESLASHHDYSEVVLTDLDGAALASAGAEGRPPSQSHIVRHLRDAIRRGGALFTDLEIEEGTGRVHLDIVAPIFDPERPAVALGGLLVRLDPSDFLFPLIQSWPTLSASAESLLVRVDGDSIVFLNELRHREGAPLSLRLPLADRRYPAVRFALGEQGVTTGLDYRGVEVLAAGRSVPETPWFIVAKVDAHEILSPGRDQAARLGLDFLILIGTGLGAIALWWRHQAALAERAEHEAEQARGAHARHLELLSEHANDVVLLGDDTGRIVRVNDRVREYYGWSSAELEGVHIRFLRAPRQIDELDSHIERIRREGHLRYETVHRRRNGTTFPVEVSGRGFESQGRWFFQAIVRDVTERKEALRAVSFQAELLKNLHDAVIALDADHVICSWNPAAERIYGLAAREVIGKRMADILPSEYPGCTYPEFVEHLDRSGRMSFEVRRRLPSGSFVDIEAAGVVLRGDDGRITGYVTVNRDVTLRKRAEAALRASQERLARILETSSEGIWIVDGEGTTEFVNERGARLLGVTPEAAVGRPHVDVVPEPGRPYVRADLEAVLRGESVKREFAMRRTDGSELWINLSWTALREPDGRVVGGVGVFMDVTEHRRAREQLLQAQKMDAVGRLASGIAHDFNNLLVAILSGSEFLLESLADGDPRREEAATIKKAGERAAGLVRQLLAFARKSDFTPVPVDLAAAVRRIDPILRRAIGGQVVLTGSLEGASSTLIDPGHLDQVVMNLAVNARDAMPGDGGELRIETADVTLEHPPAHDARLKPGRYVVLKVTDAGCGIRADVLPRIFEPFFTTKEEGRGTGLGLSTVYGIVHEAGGTIAVSSAVGGGTTFTVYLPACGEGAGRSAHPPRVEKGLRHDGRSRDAPAVPPVDG